jgi:hypothetical protein
VTNFAAIVIPFAAFVLAVVLLWGRLVEWIDLTVLAVGYAVTCLGITVGFHRLLTHRSFETYPAVRYALAALGTLAVEGSVIKWVADHRKHHAFADEHGDPHGPHDAGPGVLGALGASGAPTSAGCSTRSARRTGAATRRTSSRIAACVGSTPPRSPCSRPAWRSRSSWAS